MVARSFDSRAWSACSVIARERAGESSPACSMTSSSDPYCAISWPCRLVPDAGDARDRVARVALEPDEVRHLVGPDAVACLDSSGGVHVHVRDPARRHHQADVLRAELERVAVGRDDARLHARLVRSGRERGDDVVRLPPFELEVLIPEGFDDRPEVRELLAQEVRHRAALGLVLGGDLRPVHRPRVPCHRHAARLVVREQLEEHVREPEQRVRRLPVRRLELLGKREEPAVREVVPVDEEELALARRCVVELQLLACDGLRTHDATVSPAPAPRRSRRALLLDTSMSRIALLSGSRVVLVPVGDDDEIVRPPGPAEQVVDAGAAARDALRFPLSGDTLSALVPRGGRATIVVEPPALPIPATPHDPRQDALAATIDELARAGIPDGRQTIVLATGLGRRVSVRHAVRILLPPQRARSFRGQVLVHDAEAPNLVSLATGVRVHPVLVDCDVVVTVGAAETILHGGAGTFLAASDAGTLRRLAGADSLLEASRAGEWSIAVETEAALAARVPLVGVSLVLDLPHAGDRYRRDPEDSAATLRLANALPAVLRRALLERRWRSVAAIAAYAGRPSVAHAEALLRGIALRGTRISEPVDALVVGVPWHGPHLPREPANPLTAAACGLGLALRLRRDAFPVRPDGTLVLLHSLRRSFAPGAVCLDVQRAPRGTGPGRPGRVQRERPPPTSGRSPRIDRARPAIRCSPTRTGQDASPRWRISAASSSRAVATRRRRERSGSSRATGSEARSRWRAASPAGRPAWESSCLPPIAPLIVGET